MSISSRYLAIKLSKGLKYIVFSTNVIFIILLLLSTRAAVVPPSQSVFIAYLGMGFPVLLVINIIYLLLWILFLQWQYLLVSLVGMACCWNSIRIYISFGSESEETATDCVRVMSYNVRGFNWLTGKEARQNPILEYIVGSEADIICMQEFAVEEKRRRRSLISLDEFDQVMKEYPYRTVIRLGDTESSVIYGLACYSKYPILRVARVPIESKFNGSAMYEIRVGKKIITVVNNHLESNHLTTEDKELYKELVVNRNRDILDEVAQNIQDKLGFAFRAREIQADIIAECIQKQRPEAHAMIVCGDFNDLPVSYAYNKIKGNFVDAFTTAGKGLGITYHQDGFWFRIDYILHTRNMKALNFKVDKVKYSDHYPVYACIFTRYI